MKPATQNRYLEKDGRAYRYAGGLLFELGPRGSEKLIGNTADLMRILSHAVEVSEKRAARVVDILTNGSDQKR